MSKHWRPDNVRWLRPEDYARLSPSEKKRLWRERQHERIFGPRLRRSRGGDFRSIGRQLVVGAFVIGAIILYNGASSVSQFVDLSWFRSGTSAAASATPGERVTFAGCEWGGGWDCVVDGDTIYLHGENIRIAGIDAPETHDLYQCPEELALGQKATARLRELLNSGAVSLTSIDRDEDVYGRKLRNVAVDGRDVGDLLVSEGLARPCRGFKMGWC